MNSDYIGVKASLVVKNENKNNKGKGERSMSTKQIMEKSKSKKVLKKNVQYIVKANRPTALINEVRGFDVANVVPALTGRNPKSRSYTVLKEFTKDIKVPYTNPSRHITALMDYLNTNHNVMMRYIRGGCSELLFANAMAYFKNSDGKAININSLTCGKRAIETNDVWLKYRPDVDFNVNGNTLFQIKHSTRERGWLADRTFLVPGMEGYDKYYVFFKEYPNHTPAQAMDQAKRLQDSFISDATVLTVYDEEGVYDLFNKMAMGE